MSPNVFKGLMECCRLIPAACLINKNLQFVCKCNLGLISSAHLHLEKNNKLKFNVAIMRVYGDCGEEGGGGEAGLDERALRGGVGPTRTSPATGMTWCTNITPGSQSLLRHARRLRAEMKAVRWCRVRNNYWSVRVIISYCKTDCYDI